MSSLELISLPLLFLGYSSFSLLDVITQSADVCATRGLDTENVFSGCMVVMTNFQGHIYSRHTQSRSMYIPLVSSRPALLLSDHPVSFRFAASTVCTSPPRVNQYLWIDNWRLTKSPSNYSSFSVLINQKHHNKLIEDLQFPSWTEGSSVLKLLWLKTCVLTPSFD